MRISIPDHWSLNTAPHGTKLRIVEGEPGKETHSGKRVLRLAAGQLFTGRAKARNKNYGFSLYVKGAGRINASIYEYAIKDGKDRYLEIVSLLDQPVTAEWRKFEGSIRVTHPEAEHFAFALVVDTGDIFVDDVALWESKELLAVRAAGAPAIDGMLNDGVVVDPCWKQSVWGLGFTRAGTREPYPDDTRFSLCFDQANLYFAAIASDREADKIKAAATAREPEKVWQDECIELFLDPCGPGKPMAHLAFNARSTTALLLNNKISDNNAKIITCGKIGDKHWKIEAQIPWETLGVGAPAPGSVWKVNVAREHRHADTDKVGLSTWAYLPEPDNFHLPQCFIALRFVDDRKDAPAEMVAPTTGSVVTAASNFIVDLAEASGRTDILAAKDPVESPHIRWAKPCAGKPLRILFVVRETEREVVELQQRLELAHADVVLCPLEGDKNQHAFAVDAERIKKNLLGQGEAYDVIVVAAEIRSEELVQCILDRVKEGAGLVYLRPAQSGAKSGSTTEAFGRVLPALKPLVECRASPIMRNIVVEGLPYNVDCRPSLENNHLCRQWWENVYALLIRGIGWAAGQETPCKIAALETRDETAFSVSIQGAADVPLELEVIWDSKKIPELSKAILARIAIVKGAAQAIIPIPQEIRRCRGVHFCHAILRDARNGKALDWATGVLKRNSPTALSRVERDKPFYGVGEKANVRCEIVAAGEAAQPLKLDVELEDPHGRLVWGGRQDVATGEPTTAWRVAVPVARLMTVASKARIFLRDGRGQTLDADSVNLYVPENSRRLEDDFLLGVYHPDNRYYYQAEARLFADAGIRLHQGAAADGYVPGYSNQDTGFKGYLDFMPWIGAAPMFNEPRHAALRADGGDKYAHHQRNTCFQDPERIQKYIADVLTQVEHNYPYGMLGYVMEDEASISGQNSGPESDFCFCPRCRAGFQPYARKLHGTIGAANAEWGTVFKDWSEVQPAVLEETRVRKDRNHSLWVDYKFYMEDAYLEAFRKIKAAITDRFPKTRVGLTNPSIYGQRTALAGVNYPTWSRAETFKLDYMGDVNTVAYRSFYPADCPQATWFGYHSGTPCVRAVPWWFAFNGGHIACFFGAYSRETLGKRWVAYNLFSPRVAHTGRSLALKESAHDLVRGIGQIVRGAARVKPPIAMLYSQASMYAAAAEGMDEQYFNREYQWRNLIKDTGLDYDFVAPESLSVGLTGYPVLVLPFTLALSGENQKAIVEFIRAGGTVLADGTPGRFDEHGKYLGDQGPVPVLLKTPSAQSEDFPGGGRLTMVTHGKGRWLHLDTAPPWTRGREAMRTLLARAGVSPAVRIESPRLGGRYETYQFQQGAIQYVGIVGNVNGLGSHSRDRESGPVEIPQMPDRVTLRFERPAHLYDVRAKQYLGFVEKVETDLRMDAPRFYALLPYRVRSIKTHGDFDREAWSLRYTAEVRHKGFFSRWTNSGADVCGDHVLRVEIADPQGRSVDVYNWNLWGKQGRLDGVIPFAFNDPPGQWSITITDVVSGKHDRRNFRVPSHK